MRKKKTAKETVAEVIAKVEQDLAQDLAPTEAPKKDEPTKDHYYRCNVALNNGKPCNCIAFI